MLCAECGKPLRRIGNQRSNGIEFKSGKNNNNDWKERKYHKKCLKLLTERNELMDYLHHIHQRKLKNEEAKIKFRNMFVPYYDKDKPKDETIYRSIYP